MRSRNATGVLVTMLAVAAASVASAMPAATASPRARTVVAARCSGTFASPGLIQGTYHGTVDISGVCAQNGAPTTINGDLVLLPGSALNATFAFNDKAHNGSRTSLTVTGNVFVESGAALFLGCEAIHAPCSDSSTLAGQDTVLGSIASQSALGDVVHHSFVKGNVTQSNGGGGVNCNPTGVFADIQSPAYSTWEDVSIGGSFSLTGLQSCWFGVLRDTVHGNMSVAHNVLADPDANETFDNIVHGNLYCASNNPPVHYGDSGSSPNVVYGKAFQECAFDFSSPNPRYYFGGLVTSPNPSRSEAETIPVSIVADPFIGLAHTADGDGYWIASANGSVSHFGGAGSHGSQPTPLPFPVRSLVSTPDDGGYWLATSDGRVLHFGDAGSYGPAKPLDPGYPIIGIARTHDGKGYWLAGANGAIFPFGDAKSHGSLAGTHLKAGIVGIAATPDSGGYWLVANDGGVFGFGDARFFGSMGGRHLNRPVVGIAPTPDNKGYWLVATDGGIFSFGDARFHGSTGGIHLNSPVFGMSATPDGGGYWMLASDGGVFSLGDAGFFGSAG